MKKPLYKKIVLCQKYLCLLFFLNKDLPDKICLIIFLLLKYNSIASNNTT